MKYWWDKLDYDEIDDPDFNQANVKALYEYLCDGVSIEDACALLMIKPEQYFDWMEKSEGFRMLMQHALASYRVDIQRQVKRSATHNPAYAFRLLEQSKSEEDIFDTLVRGLMKHG